MYGVGVPDADAENFIVYGGLVEYIDVIFLWIIFITRYYVIFIWIIFPISFVANSRDIEKILAR